jgi:glycosyltransferase involved in cell wall biosynthesis
MLVTVNLLLLFAAMAISAPVLLFCLEVFLSLFPRQSSSRFEPKAGSPLAVLIPAHNEALVLAETLQTLLPTLPANCRVVVIADNCTDETPQIARRFGALVAERRNPDQWGKGYALQFGFAHLAADPPTAVVILDADCQAAPDAVRLLGETAVATGRPVQGLNLCDSTAQGRPLQAVSALAFRFKNLVRMTGLSRLAGLCYLTGTGMAIPWPLVNTARLDGNVVEDMQWGIDLAVAGRLPLFLPAARVNSPLAQSQQGAKTQRTRWEHGHLSTLLSQVPRLLWLAARHRRWNLLCLACDLAIPPLSLLVAVYVTMVVITTALAFVTSQPAPALLLLAVSPMFFLAIATGWFFHCRQVIPLRTLLAVPFYILQKLPLYGSFLWNQQRAWIRTERDLVPRS